MFLLFNGLYNITFLWRPSHKYATAAPHIQLGRKSYNFYYNFVTLSPNHINYTLPYADNPDLLSFNISSQSFRSRK